MEFHVNHPLLYIMAGILVAAVLAQSVFFLIRAWRQGKKIGLSADKMRKVILSTSVFTIAPAISILTGVLVLSKFLGIPLPWVRLSVIGALTYEVPAAESAAAAFGIAKEELVKLVTDPKVYAAIAWVMTLGILPSIVLPPLMMNKIRGGVISLKNKDQKWGDIFMASLFLGMISAFLGRVFADVRNGLVGWIPVFVLIVSAALMAVCGLLINKKGWKWLENYAISVSMLGGMIFAAVITPLIERVG